MPAKKLWIDKERSVILRSIDYSANGDERNHTDITRIDFHARIARISSYCREQDQSSRFPCASPRTRPA